MSKEETTAFARLPRCYECQDAGQIRRYNTGEPYVCGVIERFADEVRNFQRRLQESNEQKMLLSKEAARLLSCVEELVRQRDVLRDAGRDALKVLAYISAMNSDYVAADFAIEELQKAGVTLGGHDERT